MVATDDVENLVYDMKLSSVVPAGVTQENMVKELTCMDLVMKLYYLRGVYFFASNAVQGLKIRDLKEPMFKWLEICYVTSGRIRKSETGRPFIKCNDSGVRIIEARCDKTLDEWLEMKDYSLHNRLVFNQVLGPELAYSPLVHIQFTWFKCGGLSVGLSWAHVLGDAFAASNFINMWGQGMAGHLPTKSLPLPKSQTQTQTMKAEIQPSSAAETEPFSVKRVEPVGDHWVAANTCKMETFSFQITASQLHHLQSEISSKSDGTDKIPTFEALSAVIWQCIAKTREGQEPKMVTICRNDSPKRDDDVSSNNQILSVVEADFSVAVAEVSELAALIIKKSVEEKSLIEETVEKDQGLSDFLVYGANLTFVDLEEVGLYGLELKGHKPVFANYTIHGVSNEGVVLVLPGPEDFKEAGGSGRTVTVILQENQVTQLREELKKEWCIV
ncbi:Transferase [Macleaya cordata]|uniref:Transferase n=1 Tax=Macleaya cordata TaxID=56857 RepID=A0A200PUF8_MACCD|nr:Transferase [Macleaya cordata]